MTILRIDQVSKSFGGIRALDDISLDVEQGLVTAIIGPNGAGKTTLFNVVAGFYHPTKGSIAFKGKDITGLRPHQIAASGIVRTFQLVRLFNKMSLRENVMVGGHLATRGGLWSALTRPAWYREEQKQLMSAAEQHLVAVGLGTLADAKAGILTYGQQRRLEIARALAARPRLLLLDEPAAGLSVTESRELLIIIRSVTKNGTTVMLIDHDMNLVMDIADKVMVLDFGKKICEGTPAEVRRNEKVLQAYLGKSERLIRVRANAPRTAVS